MKKRYLLYIVCLFLWEQTYALEKFISLKEVQSHNTTKTCWIIVNNKVYDITRFAKSHDDKCDNMKLTDFCGKDASTVWLDKQKSDHKHQRKSVLNFERSRIGTLH